MGWQRGNILASSSKSPEALWSCPRGFNSSFCHICWHSGFVSALFPPLLADHCASGWGTALGIPWVGARGEEKWRHFAEGHTGCAVFTHRASSWEHVKCKDCSYSVLFRVVPVNAGSRIWLPANLFSRLLFLVSNSAVFEIICHSSSVVFLCLAPAVMGERESPLNWNAD